jgi:tetratricopeptide (TPR) repeat protein
MIHSRRSAAFRAAHLLILIGLLGPLALGCQGSNEARLLELQSMQQAGEFESTIEPLREILAQRPGDADANYLLGLALLRSGRTSLAVFPLQKAAQSEKHAVAGGILLASTLFNTENYEQAIVAAGRVLEADPEVVMALHVRATAYVNIGKPDLALEDAERVLEIQPDDFKAYTIKTGALVDLERFDEAEATHQKLNEVAAALGDPDTEARACAVQARFYAARDRNDEAEARFSECLQRFPNHQVVLDFAAWFWDEREDPEAGNALWRAAIEELPDSYGYRVRLAERLEDQGELEQAEAVLVEATELFDTAQAWMKLAEFRRTAEDWPGALEATERGMERVGRPNDELRFHRADLLVSAGELDRAEEAIADLEHDSYRHLVRGRLLLARGDAEGALAAIDKILVTWPNNPGARYVAGSAAMELGDFDRALAEYREAYRANQEATDAALALARIYQAQGNYKDAMGWVNTDLKKRPGARFRALRLAARIAADVENYDGARAFLDKAAGLPESDGLGPAIDRAAIERAASGPEASLASLQAAEIDLSDPANADALSSMCEDLLTLDRSSEALALVAAGLAAHPDEAAFHDLQGRILLRTGKPAEARAAFEQARNVDPEFAPALEGLARIAGLAGDHTAALALAEQAMDADPDNVDATYAAAQSLMRLGRAEQAEPVLWRAVTLEASHPGACNDLAWLLASRGENLEVALSMARRAVRAAPVSETYDTLGWVQLKRSDNEAAVKALEKSLELAPNSPSVRYHLALALAANGDPEQAQRLLQEALDTGEFPESDAARSELARLEQG